MAKIRKNDSGNLFDSMQNQSLADSAMRNRKQRRTYRKVCSVLGIGLSIVMFYTLMKPAITMETNPGQDAPQLICQMEEHVHSDACWGYDHEESEPIYAVSRELNCQFVPHAHTEDCYDEEGSLICGISESYFHVHDENCYNQGNLVCTLEEHIREESNAEVPVLVCGQEEHEGHTHSQDCYTTTWFTDEDPICGLEEGGPHEHTEECLGLVLNCEKDHEHTDECFTVGLICGLEAGEGHVHTLECYPSIRELNCDLEETEGHTHTEDCYVMQKVEAEDHIHSEACYENGRLICGKTEVWSHQHTDACWQEVQVLVSGGHIHNEECAKVLVCGLPEHEHTEACYRGNAEDIRKLLTENDTAAGEELLSEEKPEQELEEVSTGDAMTVEAASGEPEAKENGAVDQAETQLSDQEALETNGESLSEETLAGDENDLLWEDAYEEPLVAEVSGDESYDLVDEDNPAAEVNETEAEDVPDSEKTELENQETAAAVENHLQEEAGTAEETDDGLSDAEKAQEALESSTDSSEAHGDEGTTESSEASADENPDDTQKETGLTADSFGAIHFVSDFETTEDGLYAVNLGPDEGVKVQDILALAGIETEAYQVRSDIGFLEMGDDYFACRFAFEDDIVVITAGDQEIRVLCRFVKPENSADGSEEQTVDHGAAEIGDAEAEGATEETPEADAILLRGEGTDTLKAEMDPADKEAIMELVKQSMQDAADEEEIEQLIPDEETGSRIEADEKEETSGQIWKVIRVSSDEPYEGTMEITCPLKMAFRDMLPVGTRIVSVNYQLFQVNEETGEVSLVRDFVVDGDETEIRQIEFQAQSTGTWAFICSVEYEYIEYQLELNLDFSDFMADPDADMEETGIALIPDGNSERSENDAEILPYGQRRKLARGSRQTVTAETEAQKTDDEAEQTREEEEAEHQEDTLDMSAAGISLDLSRLFSTLRAQGVDVEHEFEGIHVRIAGDGKPEFVPDELNQESSDGQVSFDGQYLQILDNGTVVLRGKHLTITIHVSGFEKPGMRSEVYVYTFTENQTVRMSEIFESVGFSDKFKPARFAYEVSDPNLVTLERDGNDWIVMANNYFGEVELHVYRGWYSGTILLHNPVPQLAEGTEITADDGSVFMTLLSDTEIPYGASLTAVPSEGRDISEQISEDFDPDREINIKWFDISLGDLHDVHASVTLPGVIEVPEKAGRRVPTVNAWVYHVTDEGVERLEAAVNGTDITFETDGFSEFAVVYTVDFHWVIDGREYEFELPGGGFVSFRALMELLDAAGVREESEEYDGQSEMLTGSDALALNAMEISEATREFVEDVANVEFSRSDLVWTGNVEADTTVGAIRQENELDTQYSADLTEEQIEKINAQSVQAGDWALIGILPFESEEKLTVTMNNGDQFAIRVTDGQIIRNYVTASGETYTITLTYDEEAGIPDDADLIVSEIEAGSDAFTSYLGEAMRRMDTEVLSIARFFDIEIWYENQKIEPRSSVQVRIMLNDAQVSKRDEIDIIHFAENGVEILNAGLMEISGSNATGMVFETDSFSVYGVIAVPSAQNTNDLDGRSFTLDLGGRYITSDVIQDDTHKLRKTSQADEAAEWTLEKAEQEGKYYIYTEVNGTKKYISMSQRDSNRANADLSESPQSVFSLTDTGEGTYAFSTVCNGITYWLNEFEGQSGNGFAGWHERYAPNDRIRVTSTQPEIQINGQYALIAKYNGDYYVVLNDGTLELTERYDEENNALYGVEMNRSLLWTYGNENGSTFLRHATDSWDYQYNQLPKDTGILYTYINPANANGITSDTGTKRIETGQYLGMDGQWHDYTNYYLDDRVYGKSYCVYDENRYLTSTDHSNYIGIVEENGTYKLSGQNSQENAVEFYYATILPTTVLPVSPQNHTVNHIDISIEGNTEYKVPLAYGTYYYYDEDDTAHERPHMLVVDRDHNVTLNLQKEVGVTEDDIKKAEIRTYKIENGEQNYLDNTFYITGYSGNASNDISTAQVRIEGVFQVADLDPYTKKHNGDENGCGGNTGLWDDGSGKDIQTMNQLYGNLLQDRLDNRIYYQINTVKDVSFEWLYEGKQLYTASGKALKSDVTMNLTTTFDYWNEENECPPLVNFGSRNTNDWKAGMIVGDGGLESSGMDFKLISKTEEDPNTVAIEIVKEILNTDGEILSPRTTVSNKFMIYRKDGDNPDEFKFQGSAGNYTQPISYEDYQFVHELELSVGHNGEGIEFDYDVPVGKTYIEENKDSIQKVIIDTEGYHWQYDHTSIATEYVWRNDGFDDARHFSENYNEDSAALRSIPEMVGPYTVNGDATWQTDDGKSGVYRNGFLEFYVYNVYKPVPTVNVPVSKSWEDASEWTAEFVLQWAPLYEGQTKPTTDFVDYINRNNEKLYVTLSNDHPTNNDAFTGLPKYGVDAHGREFRYQYSLDEISYTAVVNGETITRNAAGHTGELYEPLYPHDAGELSEADTDYYIEVSNVPSTIVDEKYIDVPFNKTWENGAVIGDDSFASFTLFRYKRQAHRDTSHMTSADFEAAPITITVKDTTGKTWDQIEVQPNVGVYISMNLKDHNGNTSIDYTLNNVTGNISNNNYNSGIINKATDHFYLSADTEIILSNGSGTSDSLNYLQSVNLLDTETGTAAALDETFSKPFTLNNSNGWHEDFHLKSMETTASDGTNQNITYYEYYFVENESNPAGYYAEFTPSVSQGKRLTSSVTISAENKKIPPLYVKKEWHDIEDPDNYPEIRFTLYQGVLGSVKDYSTNPPTDVPALMEGQVFVGNKNESYIDIPLNSDNHWTWKCPGYLPTENAAGQTVGYYVVENTGNGSGGRQVLLYENSVMDETGAIISAGQEITTSQAGKDEVWLWNYYNDQNGNTAYRNDQQQPRGWEGGFAGNTGTLTIVNRSPKYMQMDIKKKIMEYQDDGSLATTTGWPSRTKDIVLKIQMMRRIYLADAAVDAEPLVNWTNYGNPFYVGYDSEGHDIVENNNDFDCGVGLSSWHWTIIDQNQENGLPAYGYYTLENGERVKVHYRYIPFEIGAYKNTEEEPIDPQFDWFIGLQPNAWDGAHGQVGTFAPMVGQDQDRLMNVQASDLEVDKEWGRAPDNVEEVYVKIYRQAGNSPIEDFTGDIATRTETLDVYGFVDDPSRLKTIGDGVLVLGLTPETGGVLIHKVLMTPATDNGDLNTNYYEYWIEEVGYKDKDGNVYLNSNGTSVVSGFFPEYGKSNNQGEWIDAWTTNPTDNRIKLSTKGKNKLRVRNFPTKDVDVEKKWIDENGQELSGPWNKPETEEPVASSISFKIRRSDGQYLTFNGKETLEIRTEGQRAVVRAAEAGGSVYSVTYVADSVDEADIGNWHTYVHGLEKYASDGTEYVYIIEEVKDQNGKPIDGAGNVISNCHTTVSGSGSRYVIRNEKISTSLSIEKVFDGDKELTDEQKQNITFTVTGPGNYSKTFFYGVDQDGFVWNNGILVISDIVPGHYVVEEAHDDAVTVFGQEIGSVIAHTRVYKVGNAETSDSASATVLEGERTHVMITNTYNERLPGIRIVKIDEATRGNTPLTKLAGAEFTLYRYGGPTSAVYTVFPDSEAGVKTTSAVIDETFGTVIYPELPDGQYKLVETKQPAGYVKNEVNDVYFDIVNGVLTRYRTPYSGEARNAEDAISETQNVALVTYHLESEDPDLYATFTVGNTPGVALPSTGGPGTVWLTILGMMFVMAGGMGILLQRKRNYRG